MNESTDFSGFFANRLTHRNRLFPDLVAATRPLFCRAPILADIRHSARRARGTGMKLALLVTMGPFVSGCISSNEPLPRISEHTRVPTIEWNHPEIERQGYERHDPFPDKYLGPDTLSRPRGYNIQRTESRQLTESMIRLQMFNQLHYDPYRPNPRNSPIGSRYPQTVKP